MAFFAIKIIEFIVQSISSSYIGNAFTGEKDIETKVNECYKNALNQFNEKYKKAYGYINDSFLNWNDNEKVILNYIFLSSDVDLKKHLITIGFNGEHSANDEEIEFFVQCFKNVIHEDFELDSIITKKEFINGAEIYLKNINSSITEIKKDVKEIKEKVMNCKLNCKIISKLPPYISSFIGRIHELDLIDEKFSDGNNVIFIYGMGGIGKSELCKKYINMNKANYENICWMNNEDDIVTTITNNLDFAGIEYPNKSIKDIYSEKIKFLHTFDEKTLIIIDNFDKGDCSSLKDMLSGRYRVLITTRFIVDEYCSINLSYMNIIELKNLFYTYFPKDDEWKFKNDHVIIDIIKEVNYHTLTVELIAKTLKCSGIEVSDMLNALKENGIDTGIEEKVKHTKDGSYSNEIMYNHIHKLFDMSKLSQDEKCILMNLALVNNNGINRNMFRHWLHLKNNNDINGLIDRGWITFDNNHETINLHSVISDVVFNELKPDSFKCSDFLRGLRDEIMCPHESADFEYNNSKKLTIAIAEYVVNRLKDNSDIVINIIWITAQAYKYIGNFDKSIGLYNYIIPIIIERHGELNLDVSTAYNCIGLVLSENGEHDKGLCYLEKSCYIKEKLLGADNIEIASVHNNLGENYYNKGDYSNALNCYFKVLSILEKNHVTESTFAATCYNNIAAVYDSTNKVKEAIEYNNKALEIRLEKLGQVHAETASSYNNLSACYYKLHEYEQALNYSLKARTIVESVYGKEHPGTLCVYNGIALIYYETGKYTEALIEFKNLLCVSIKILGANHPNVASVYDNIGLVHHALKQYEKALEVYEKAKDINENIFGKENLITAQTYNNLAMLYCDGEGDVKDYNKAIEYFNKALVSYEKKYYTNIMVLSSIYSQLINIGRIIDDKSMVELYMKRYNTVKIM